MFMGPALLRNATREQEAHRNQQQKERLSRDFAGTNPDAFPEELSRPRDSREHSNQLSEGPAASNITNMESSYLNSDEENSVDYSHHLPVPTHHDSDTADQSENSLVFSGLQGKVSEPRKKASRNRNRAWGLENTTYCCGLDRAIHSVPSTAFNPPLDSKVSVQTPPVITISEAVKSQDMTGAYIAYVIHTELPEHQLSFEARHRYSEFDSLRKLLLGLHPTTVVPPIPEKHSVANYAAKAGKAKEDPTIIEKRKHMLQSFLNRVAAHPILNEEHVFHRFLEGEATWSDILSTSGLSVHLKKETTTSAEKGTLRHPDKHFIAAEDYTARFAAQTSQTLKVHRKIAKDIGDAAACYSDLGATYNGWSLTETPLSRAIEEVGGALDSTVTASNQMSAALEDRFADALQEYILFSKTVEKLLRWRHGKHVEFETVCDSLIEKQNKLSQLEASEAEAQRLAAVLNAEGALGSAPQPPPTTSTTNPSSSASPYSTANSTTPHPKPTGLFATLNSLIDNDPEQSRRNAISKTRDKIVGLQQQREQLQGQLVSANGEIQANLDGFQMDKVRDLRNMLVGYAIAKREYHRKCVAVWREAAGRVDEIRM